MPHCGNNSPDTAEQEAYHHLDKRNERRIFSTIGSNRIDCAETAGSGNLTY